MEFKNYFVGDIVYSSDIVLNSPLKKISEIILDSDVVTCTGVKFKDGYFLKFKDKNMGLKNLRKATAEDFDGCYFKIESEKQYEMVKMLLNEFGIKPYSDEKYNECKKYIVINKTTNGSGVKFRSWYEYCLDFTSGTELKISDFMDEDSFLFIKNDGYCGGKVDITNDGFTDELEYITVKDHVGQFLDIPIYRTEFKPILKKSDFDVSFDVGVNSDCYNSLIDFTYGKAFEYKKESEEIKMENVDKKTIKEGIKQVKEEMKLNELNSVKLQYEIYNRKMSDIEDERAELDQREKDLREQYKEIVEVLEEKCKK